MTLTVNLPPAMLEKVRAEAAATGKDVDTVVREAIEVSLAKWKPALAEVLKPINDAMQASGLSEAEATKLFDGEVKAHRTERRAPSTRP